QRLHCVRDEIATNDQWLSALRSGGEKSRKNLGEGCDALCDAFDDAQLRWTGAERDQKCRQDPVSHFGCSVVEEGGNPERIKVARSGRLRFKRCSRHNQSLNYAVVTLFRTGLRENLRFGAGCRRRRPNAPFPG